MYHNSLNVDVNYGEIRRNVSTVSLHLTPFFGHKGSNRIQKDGVNDNDLTSDTSGRLN